MPSTKQELKQKKPKKSEILESVAELWKNEVIKRTNRKLATSLSNVVQSIKEERTEEEFDEIRSLLQTKYGNRGAFKKFANSIFEIEDLGRGRFNLVPREQKKKKKAVKKVAPNAKKAAPSMKKDGNDHSNLSFGAKEKYNQINVQSEVELEELLNVLPQRVVEFIKENVPIESLVDIILDIEREITFIINDGENEYDIRMDNATESDIETILSSCLHVTEANRACIGNTLHRCSIITDPTLKIDKVVGMTIRISRIVNGMATSIHDILESKKSILIVGTPGSGKTTLLRDIAQYVSSRDTIRRRTMIVDTNNEIGGENTRTHKAVGDARRMKVGQRSRQYRVMLEAVQNHTPQCLIIDEIGTSQEANQAVSISQRGIQLIATTHGTTLADVVQNPETRNLLGGANTVILSAVEVKQHGSEKKTRIERKTIPAFEVVIELVSRTKWRIHYDVLDAVDVILNGEGKQSYCEIREFDFEKSMFVSTEAKFPELEDDD